MKVYKHTDAGAPQNSNVAGSLISLLNACLVTGYGDKTGAGWTIPFSGTNVAVFKSGVGSNGMNLKVTDTLTTAARVKCFESMTDLTTGTGEFPMEAQVAGGLYMQKPATATPAEWTIVATEKFFIAVINNGTSNQLHIFGDFNTKKVGDLFNTIAIFPISATTSDASPKTLTASGFASTAGHYLARQHTNVGGSIACGKSAGNTGQTTLGGSGGFPYPSPIDGSLHISPISINEPTVGFRGELPIIFNINHQKPFQNLDVITGTGELEGRTFLALNLGTSDQCLLETTA